MPLTVSDGALLVRDGKLGIEQACCCDGDGVCCGPDCGVVFAVDFLPDAGMQAAFTAFLQGRGYSNIEYAEDAGPGIAFWSADCCKSDPGDTDTFTVTGGGNSTTFTVPLCLVNKPAEGVCVEGLTPEECQALSGTVVAASSCASNPCACPGGGPGLGSLNPDFCGGYDFCCTADGCVPAGYFMADVADCVCFTGESPGGAGVYATYAECCAENFCPDPPP